MTDEEYRKRTLRALESIAESLKKLTARTMPNPVQYRTVNTPNPHAVRIEGETDLDGEV